MKTTKNAHGKLTAVSIGGKGNPTATFTLAFEVYLSEWGDGGFADTVFEAAPTVLAAMRANGASGVKMSLQAEELFDGLKAHRFNLWGLPEGNRRPEAEALVHTTAANIKGQATFELTFGEGAGNVACEVKLPVKAPTGELPDITLRELGTQLHGECWVDIECLQSELDPVEPVKNPRGGGEQSSLGFDDGRTLEADAPAPGLPAPEEPGDGEWGVSLLEVPEHPLAVVNILVELPSIGSVEEARGIVESVATGEEWAILEDVDKEYAERLGERLGECGCTWRLDGPGGHEEEDAQPEAAGAPPPPAAGNGETPIYSLEEVRGLGDEQLGEYLMGLTVDDLRAVHERVLGKATRSSNPEFICNRIRSAARAE